MKTLTEYKAFYKSPIGTFELTATDKGLSKLKYIDSSRTDYDYTKIPEQLHIPIQQLNEYFNFSRIKFELKIDLTGTPFQHSVWKRILEIPYGKTMTYLELAELVRNKSAIRAVASANGKNPLPIIVPCHRVLGVNKKMIGYIGGIWRKEWLINFESGLVQTSLF